MRSASAFGSSFLLPLALLVVAAAARPCEAASPSSKAGAARPSAAAHQGLAQSATTQPSTTPDAVDPWEGKGPPADEATAAEPASPEPPPPVEEKLDPRTAYHKGNAAFREGRYTAARHYYRVALQGDVSFDVLCNLGRAEAELKDNVPAYVHLTQGLQIYPRDPELAATRTSFTQLKNEVEERLTPEQRARAEALLAEGLPQPTAVATAAPAAATTPAPPPPDVDLGPRSPGLRLALTIGLGGLALAGAGTGIGFLIYSSDLGAQAEDLQNGILNSSTEPRGCPEHSDCAALESTLAQSDDMQHVALGSFIAAGALATSAVLTYVLWPHEYGPAPSARRPGPLTARNVREVRPTASFDPAQGTLWLGVRGRF